MNMEIQEQRIIRIAITGSLIKLLDEFELKIMLEVIKKEIDERNAPLSNNEKEAVKYMKNKRNLPLKEDET